MDKITADSDCWTAQTNRGPGICKAMELISMIWKVSVRHASIAK